MTCKKCGKNLPDGSRYCPFCGKKQLTEKRLRHPKRTHGSGSIIKLSGNRALPWLARLPETIVDGKINRPVLGCYATYKEAVAALMEVRARGKIDKAALTLKNIYDIFTAGNYFAELSPQGKDSHRKAWKYLQPWGDEKIKEITALQFQAAADAMRDKGLKRETIAKMRNLASLLCKECMRLGLMEINYGQLVQLPREDKVSRPSFTVAQLSSIWAFAETGRDDFENHTENIEAKKLEKQNARDQKTAWAILIMCYTGLRPSELLELDLTDQLRTTKNAFYFYTGSKTEAGQDRIVPIPTVILPFIEKLTDGRTTGPLVTAPAGGVWRLENWRKRAFKPLMERLELNGVTPYTCRHTYADIQKRRKIDPEIMMEIMGHEDYSTTVEHYHTTTEDDIDLICRAVVGLKRPDLLATDW